MKAVKHIINKDKMLSIAANSVIKSGLSTFPANFSFLSESEYNNGIEYLWEDNKRELTHFDVVKDDDNDNIIVVNIYSCEEYGATIVKPNDLVTTIQYDKKAFMKEMMK